MCFMEYSLFAGMVLVHGIVLPELVIVDVNSLDARLNDRIAACKARKFCDVNGRALKGATANAGRVHNGIDFGVADDLQFLVRIKKSLLIVMNTRAKPLKPVDRTMLSSDTITAPTGHFGSLDFMETALAMFKKYSSQLSTCAGMSMRGDSASVSSAPDKGKVGCVSDIPNFNTRFTSRPLLSG